MRHWGDGGRGEADEERDAPHLERALVEPRFLHWGFSGSKGQSEGGRTQGRIMPAMPSVAEKDMYATASAGRQ